MNNTKKVLLTGAAGGMGYESLRQMVEDGCDYEIIACDLPNDKSRERLKEFENNSRVTIMLGDLTNYRFVLAAALDCDLIIHIAAFVSPAADYFP
jgi:nucleoside-diphosphate-sugar epimerase